MKMKQTKSNGLNSSMVRRSSWSLEQVEYPFITNTLRATRSDSTY